MHTTKKSKTIVMVFAAWISLLLLCGGFTSVTLPVFAETATESVTEYPMPSDTVVLTKGTKSDDVKWLQSALNTVTNANLTVDGDFGGRTETALIEFQKIKGLEANGKADAATINALAEAIGVKNPVVTEPIAAKTEASDEKESSGHYFRDYWKNYFENANDLVFHFKDKYADIKDYLGGFASALVLCLTMGIGAAFSIVVILAVFGISEDLVSVLSKLIIGMAVLIFLIPCFVDMYYINDNYSISGFKLIGIELLYLIIRLLIGAAIAAVIGLIIGIIVSSIIFLVYRIQKKYLNVFENIFDVFGDVISKKTVRIFGGVMGILILFVMYIIPIFMKFS